MNATNAPRPFPLREAHAHLAMHGREMTQVDLSHVESHPQLLDVLRAAADRLDREDPSDSRWLLANGARVEGWTPPQWPAKTALDAIAPRRPLAMMSFDHHATMVNSAAMTLCGLATSADPEGGVIVRDATGQPTGLMLEAASWKVRMTVPEMTPAERELAVLAAIEDLRTKGFAEVHDLLAPAWLGPLLADLHDRGLLQVHVELFAAADAIEPLLATRKEWERDRVRLAGMKAFADGTLNSRTAWMLEPYLNPLQDHPRGTPLMTEEDLAAMFRQCREAGLGAAVHAIGDGAVRACLNAFEREPPKRLRIEHAEVIHPADVGRFASLGVVASVQPCHLLYDIEVLERELRGVLDRVLPLRSLIGAGLVPGQSLIFGSDVPIVRADPEDSILAATQRRRPPGCVAGNESAAIGKSEAIEQAEAWTCFRAAAM